MSLGDMLHVKYNVHLHKSFWYVCSNFMNMWIQCDTQTFSNLCPDKNIRQGMGWICFHVYHRELDHTGDKILKCKTRLGNWRRKWLVTSWIMIDIIHHPIYCEPWQKFWIFFPGIFCSCFCTRNQNNDSTQILHLWPS